MGNFSQETAGNTTGAGIKLVAIPRDGNLIDKNPAVAIGKIVHPPVGDILHICIATLRYGPITNSRGNGKSVCC